MIISSLRLFRFRNLAQHENEFKPRLNFLVGANGQGKTNLIEAVFLLSRGDSFRPANFENYLFNFKAAQARITAKLKSDAGDYKLQIDFADGRRTPHLDGKRTRFSTLSAEFPVVLFSPESLASIKEGPEQRRILIDNVLATLSIRDAKLLTDFHQTLRARNALLRQIADGDNRSTTLQSLESLTSLFLVIGTHVTASRLAVLRQMAPRWQESARHIFGIDDLSVSLEYLISDSCANAWSDEQVFNALSQRQSELSRREMEYGGSLVGPHKHDLRILFSGNDSRFSCSQGQQRALILAFKIAQIDLHHSVTGRYPILLLDDVMSELDADKRMRLMEYLEGINAQVLITATDLTWSRHFPEERNAVFKVENGTVTLTAPSAVRAVMPTIG